MYIIQEQANIGGARPPLQEWSSYIEGTIPPEGFLWCPDEYLSVFYDSSKRCAGFVNIKHKNKIVTSMTWNDEDYNKYVATLPDPTDGAKAAKIDEVSKCCEEEIHKGADVKLSNATKHFSYKAEDQSNVSEMMMAVMGGATEYPYHADGEECQLYNAQDIVTIYSALSMYKTGHITYNNQLKQYINSLKNIDEVEAIQYGVPLTGEYLNKYSELMAQAEMQIKSVVNKMAL